MVLFIKYFLWTFYYISKKKEFTPPVKIFKIRRWTKTVFRCLLAKYDNHGCQIKQIPICPCDELTIPCADLTGCRGKFIYFTDNISGSHWQTKAKFSFWTIWRASTDNLHQENPNRQSIPHYFQPEQQCRWSPVSLSCFIGTLLQNGKLQIFFLMLELPAPCSHEYYLYKLFLFTCRSIDILCFFILFYCFIWMLYIC